MHAGRIRTVVGLLERQLVPAFLGRHGESHCQRCSEVLTRTLRTIANCAKPCQINRSAQHLVDSGLPPCCLAQYMKFFRVKRTEVLDVSVVKDLDRDS